MSRRVRIVVDRDLCEANGMCEIEAPDVFQIGEDDEMRVLMEDVPEEHRKAVDAAVRRCPKAALSLVEHD